LTCWFRDESSHFLAGPGISLVATLDALRKIIRAAGFQRQELVHPTASLHEQYVDFDRVIVFAFV
jgi:hypothetical protein